MALLPPIPAESLLVTTEPDPRTGVARLTGYISEDFRNWFFTITGRLDSNPLRAVTLRILAQAASIGATALPVPSLTAGLYRVSYITRITQAASTSSSLIVRIGWTEGAIGLAIPGDAMVGNTVDTVQTGTVTMRIDQSSPITYQTTYASVGGTPMRYSVEFVVEEIPA